MQQLVNEWRPTLHPANRFDFWYYPYLAYLALLGACFWLRRREKPLVDLCLALVLAWMSLRARRFVGDFAVLALPLLARSIYRALERWVEPRFWAPRHGFNIALTALMLATTARYELAINPMARRPFGLGFGGNLAYEQVAYLEKSGLHGAIMNDYEDGALIIHELFPKLRPVMDSRIDIYGAELVDEWIQASFYAADFVRYAEKYGVNVVLRRPFVMRADEVQAYLRSSPEWERVPTSPGRYMFVRRHPLPAVNLR
jgi:hypothetical protein